MNTAIKRADVNPRAWLVTWQAFGTVPAGSHEFPQRSRARGFYLMRKAAGFTVSIEPVT